MIIFTGVYGAKLMQQWQGFEDGNVTLLFLLLFFTSSFFLTNVSLLPQQRRLCSMKVIG
jgi:hypothetical protein